MKRVIGIGNALTDMLVNLNSDTVLDRFRLPKGSMSLVDTQLQTEISKSVAGLPYSLSLGGSAGNTIRAMALKVNEVLKAFFAECGVRLIDFKLEFGRLPDGTIVLADEISPDTCRFWDAKTNEKLDKDRFRRDLGSVEEAYEEMMRRVFGA